MVSKAQPQSPATTRWQTASLHHFCVGSPVLWHRGDTCHPDGSSRGPKKWPWLPEEISYCAFWRGKHSPKASLSAVVGRKTKNSPGRYIMNTRQALTSRSCAGGRAQPWAEVPVEVLWPGYAPSWGSDPLRAPVGWGNVTCHWQRVGSAARDQTAMAGVGLPIKGAFWGQ